MIGGRLRIEHLIGRRNQKAIDECIERALDGNEDMARKILSELEPKYIRRIALVELQRRVKEGIKVSKSKGWVG